MTDCFEKARDLGRLVLASELADRVRIAKEIGDDEQLLFAQAKFDKLLQQVVDVFTATVTGEMPTASPGGHCGGCGKHG